MIEAVVSIPVQYLLHVLVLKLDSSSKPRATASASCKTIMTNCVFDTEPSKW